MRSSKTLSLSLFAGLALAAPVYAAVSLDISSDKTFRQLKSSGKEVNVQFRGGTLSTNLDDGDFVFAGSCSADVYRPLGTLGCPTGTPAFVDYGSLPEFQDVTTFLGPYYNLTGLVSAIAIEPRNQDRAHLRSAPASTLQRPLYNFTDTSLAVYYNLHTSNVKLYEITGYRSLREYGFGDKERGRFDKEIIPGVYNYSFPRRNMPTLSANISSTIFPMTDGPLVRNSQRSGLRFETSGREWSKKGFLKLGTYRPNTLRWTGLTQKEIVASDRLYFSVKYLQNRRKPTSPVVEFGSEPDPITGEVSPISIFPTFQEGTDPRILLQSPLTGSFTLPPVLESGDTGIVRLELVRGLRTGGVTFDFSTRTFELPVTVANLYTDYAEIQFDKNAPNTGLLDDFDGDGYNNLTEWALKSSAVDKDSIPREPRPALQIDEEDRNGIVYPDYYGFRVLKQQGLEPGVRYRLQRSTDGGVTWVVVETDANWILFVDQSQIRLVSRTGGQPPGTAGDRYRVKVTRKR